MRSSAIIATAVTGIATLAGFASASPAHKFDKHAAHIAYTYPNGTFTKPFDVATNGAAQQFRMLARLSKRHIYICMLHVTNKTDP